MKTVNHCALPQTSRSPRTRRPLHLTALAVATICLGWLAAPAYAATSYSLESLSATVSGTEVTATASVRASVSTNVDAFGVCVRNSSGANFDYVKPAARISTAGTAVSSQTKSFTAGTYTYSACINDSGTWITVGATQTFSVGSPAAPANPPTSMPTGDLTGWRLGYVQDFTKDAALGQIGQVYGQTMRGYDGFADTNRNGRYAPDRVLSVSDGMLHYKLHTVGGVPQVAAPVPMGWIGQTYGRFSMRYRTSSTTGYTHSFLLFPESNNWNEGEIDFPNGNLGTKPYGSSVKKGSLNSGGVVWDPVVPAFVPTTATDWHVATIEWQPGLVRWLWDEVEIGRTSTPSAVPNTPFRWVLQAETSDWNVIPAASAVGTIDIDWLVTHTYAP